MGTPRWSDDELRLLAVVRQADEESGGLWIDEVTSEEEEMLERLAASDLVEYRQGFFRITAAGCELLRLDSA
jgi:hypothetical protein